MNMTWILRSNVSIYLVHLIRSFGACLLERRPQLQSLGVLYCFLQVLAFPECGTGIILIIACHYPP